MGALRLSDKKTRIEFLEKGTGENFFKVLEGVGTGSAWLKVERLTG